MCNDCTKTETIGNAMKTNIVINDGKMNQKNVRFFIKLAWDMQNKREEVYRLLPGKALF